jgi:hypothetical protein
LYVFGHIPLSIIPIVVSPPQCCALDNLNSHRAAVIMQAFPIPLDGTPHRSPGSGCTAQQIVLKINCATAKSEAYVSRKVQNRNTPQEKVPLRPYICCIFSVPFHCSNTSASTIYSQPSIDEQSLWRIGYYPFSYAQFIPHRAAENTQPFRFLADHDGTTHTSSLHSCGSMAQVDQRGSLTDIMC